MSKQQHLTAEERLEIIREKLAPTLARMGMQIHLDGERRQAAERHQKQAGGGKAA